MMSAILGNRPRGFLLDLQSGLKGGITGESEVGYPGWKRVVNKVPSLQEIRESLSGLCSACQDVASEKVYLISIMITCGCYCLCVSG